MTVKLNRNKIIQFFKVIGETLSSFDKNGLYMAKICKA